MKTDSKRIIWAFYDSECGSCYNALKEQATVFSFGKCSTKKKPENLIEMDLSDFTTTVKTLNYFPKPHFIFSHPPCESWGLAGCAHKPVTAKHKILNLHYKNKWQPNDFKESFKLTRLNGELTARFTAQVIKHFKPQAFFIENPNRSYLFDFLAEKEILLGYLNKCNYWSYGHSILKTTIIYSNLLLNLKNTRPRKAECLGNLADLTKYSERVAIPAGLFLDIYSQALMGGQKRLF